jgi:hypothetical protein
MAKPNSAYKPREEGYKRDVNYLFKKKVKIDG